MFLTTTKAQTGTLAQVFNNNFAIFLQKSKFSKEIQTF